LVFFRVCICYFFLFFFFSFFCRGRLIYEPPRYMTVAQAVEQLLQIEDARKENGMIGDWFFMAK
jgi:hypothetical protein